MTKFPVKQVNSSTKKNTRLLKNKGMKKSGHRIRNNVIAHDIQAKHQPGTKKEKGRACQVVLCVPLESILVSTKAARARASRCVPTDVGAGSGVSSSPSQVGP